MYETKQYFYGTGRRKHSVARVRVYNGTGKITINNRDIDDYFGLLGSMCMLSSLVAVQAGHSLSAQGVGRNHALNSVGHSLIAGFSHQGLILGFLQATDPARMGAMILLFQLLASQNSFVAVNHDDMVTAVNIGGKGSLVLTTQQDSGLGSNAAERFAGSINNIPLAVDHLSGLSENKMILFAKSLDETARIC